MPAARNLDGTTGTAAQRVAIEINKANTRLKRHIAHLPDVKETVFHLTERELFALNGAWLTHTGWRVRIEFQAELARGGLCEVRGPHLTAYGIMVRREVMRRDS